MIATILFMALVLAASLQGLAVSGHFPRGHKAVQTSVGSIVLFGSITLAIVCLAIGILETIRMIPWYAVIIGGGLSLLAAPLVLQWFPDGFVDGGGAPITFAGLGIVLTSALIWLASGAW